ncbi:MAG: substrate-binding domain-containing protein [Methylococcaceae bacterium]
MKELFGLALVKKQRGKGTHLSELGKKLIDITEKNKQNIKPSLTTSNEKANQLLQTELTKSQQLIIVASDSEKINKLRQYNVPIEIHIDGSGAALAAYAKKKCNMAGFHIITRGKHHHQLAEYTQHLDKKQDQFVLLERRQQGIISYPYNPVDSLQDIVDKQLIFVNRQIGSGTRLLVDNLLNQKNIKQENIKGYYHEEHTHLAVASMIASKQADVTIGIESAAKRLNLYFSPICSEYYFLVFKELNAQIQEVLNILSNSENILPIDYSGFVTYLE